MGLSNEERYDKICYSIGHIDKLATDLKGKSHRDYSKLNKLCSSLWYNFLKTDADGLFWIMGSDLGNEYMGTGLTSAAFCCHAPSRGDTLEDLCNERRKTDKYYDHYKVLSDFFDMDRLLEKEKRAVMLIYAHTQNIAYALCRYRDEFLKSYEDLNILRCQIQGECFQLMKADKDYAYAWMVHQLCNKIYTLDEKDIVNQWWTKQCIPHHVKLVSNKYDEICAAFTKYQFRKLTVQDRIDLSLIVIDKYTEYEHQHREFIEMIEKYNKKHKKNKIALAPINEAFEKTKKLKAEEHSGYERSCEFTGNYIDRKGKIDNWRS